MVSLSTLSDLDLEKQVATLSKELAALRKAVAKRGGAYYEDGRDAASDYYGQLADRISDALPAIRKQGRAIDAIRPASGFSLYRRGLLMHLTNPKALLGWIATMTLGLGPGATPTTVAIIRAGCAILSVTIFCGYALVFSTAPMIRMYRHARRWIEGTLALVFGAAGMKLLLSRA